MRVRDMMNERVQMISPATPAEEAWNLMRTKHLHHLVVAKGSRILGILSDRDAGVHQGAQKTPDRVVADLMTVPVIAVTPTTTVRKAAQLMRGRTIGCLVVTDEGRVAGVITICDLLEQVERGCNRQPAVSKRIPADQAQHRKVHRAVSAR
jgi:acetoin utilization protein AcuB